MLTTAYHRQPYFRHNLPAIIVSFFILAALLLGCADKEEYDALEARIVLPREKVEIFEGEKLYFSGQAISGQPPYEYSWTFGAVMPQNSQKEPGFITFEFEGGYKVVLTAKDSSGATSEDYVHISVKEKPF